jgi:hypothetical protein
VLVEKSQFLETFKQFLHNYTPEIEFHHNQVCEQILTTFYEILGDQVNGIFRFSKRVYEFSNNALIKQTKRLLIGPDNDHQHYSEQPSMLLVNS